MLTLMVFGFRVSLIAYMNKTITKHLNSIFKFMQKCTAKLFYEFKYFENTCILNHS